MIRYNDFKIRWESEQKIPVLDVLKHDGTWGKHNTAERESSPTRFGVDRTSGLSRVTIYLPNLGG